jgi:hypothetical protein
VTVYAGGGFGAAGTGLAAGSGSSTAARLPNESLKYCFHFPAGSITVVTLPW